MYFVAKEIEESRMPAVFLTLIGKDSYALLQNLLWRTKPYEVTIELGHGKNFEKSTAASAKCYCQTI